MIITITITGMTMATELPKRMARHTRMVPITPRPPTLHTLIIMPTIMGKITGTRITIIAMTILTAMGIITMRQPISAGASCWRRP
jgi:hypothetical protein